MILDTINTNEERLHDAALAIEEAREALIKAMGHVDALTLRATSTPASKVHAALGNAVAGLDDARRELTGMASQQMSVRADVEGELL